MCKAQYVCIQFLKNFFSSSTFICRCFSVHCLLPFFISVFCFFISQDVEARSKYAAIVIDANTDKILFSRHADKKRYPASLTKIMTLYMLFKELKAGRIALDSKFIVTKNAALKPPSRIGLKPQEKITVINAIRALVTKSANDVATTVAENLAGTEAGFAREMTNIAIKMGMQNTKFKNASGLPNGDQYTTAKDMIILAKRMQSDFPKYYKFFKTKVFVYKGKKYKNHNNLLKNYHGTDGIKTGYTRASGFNLVTSIRRKNKHLLAVVMGGKTAKKRDAHMRRLLSRAFPKARAMNKQQLKNYKNKLAKQKELNTEVRKVVQAKFTVQNNKQSALRQTEVQNQPKLNILGPFHIQVGAYSNMVEAQSKLLSVVSRADDLLEGHPAIAVPFHLQKKKVVRARFASFSKTKAKSICNSLKRRSIECIVMQAK